MSTKKDNSFYMNVVLTGRVLGGGGIASFMKRTYSIVRILWSFYSNVTISPIHVEGASWSYGSKIYNYPLPSMPITTDVVSSKPAHGEVYSIQHYVRRLSVTYDRSVVFSGFSGSSNYNTDRHDIAEILSKVVLSTIILTG